MNYFDEVRSAALSLILKPYYLSPRDSSHIYYQFDMFETPAKEFRGSNRFPISISSTSDQFLVIGFPSIPVSIQWIFRIIKYIFIFSISEPAEPTIADQYFTYNARFKVTIYREYEYAVRIQELVRYLTNPKGTYRISKVVVQQVLEIIKGEQEVNDEIGILPTHVNYPIPGLTIYQDRLKCIIYSDVYRSPGTIRLYQYKEHQFAPYSYPIGVTAVNLTAVRVWILSMGLGFTGIIDCSIIQN